MNLATLLGERPARRITRFVLLLIALLATLVVLFAPAGGYEILRGLLSAAGIEIIPYAELEGASP